MDTILRSEVLKQLDGGEPFSMAFVTADRRRGTGGKLIKVENWVKAGEASSGLQVSGSRLQVDAAESGNSKNPNHYKRGTINIMNPGNKQVHIHKVHTALILSFNGKKVING